MTLQDYVAFMKELSPEQSKKVAQLQKSNPDLSPELFIEKIKQHILH